MPICDTKLSWSCFRTSVQAKRCPLVRLDDPDTPTVFILVIIPTPVAATRNVRIQQRVCVVVSSYVRTAHGE
jgi:hypothetical protein